MARSGVVVLIVLVVVLAVVSALVFALRSDRVAPGDRHSSDSRKEETACDGLEPGQTIETLTTSTLPNGGTKFEHEEFYWNEPGECKSHWWGGSI